MEWLEANFGIEGTSLNIWWRLAIIAAILIIAYLVDFIFNRILIPTIKRITDLTSAKWDDILLSEKVCKTFSALLPPIILTFALPFALKGQLEVIVSRLTLIYIVINVCRFLSVLVGAIFDLFKFKQQQRATSLKGICQTFQIVIWFIGIIIMISILIDKSPLYLITGLGAFATVMMLVFQDSIKGLVAGMQLSINDMVRTGDWIVMPNRNVDGVVTEISLTTVKVQNWDNTIMTVQPYALITETFQNWRGMSDGDGRRIARSVNVNMQSVRCCTESEFNKWRSENYLPETAILGVATNLEAFRNCIENYLRADARINKDMTLMVRELTAGPEGLPVQIYCFSCTKVWEEYEGIQSQLVEYCLARMKDFDLVAYQRSTGADKLLFA